MRDLIERPWSPASDAPDGIMVETKIDDAHDPRAPGRDTGAAVMYYTDPDHVRYQRALGILFRMGLERTGWRGLLRRWWYSDEALRNDAANLVREAGYQEAQPLHTRLIGSDADQGGGMKFVRRGRRYGS